jgi:hypothetical protein
MRDKLAAEIADLGSVGVAVEWARASIAAKNTLTAEDARIVETAFRDRMQVLESRPEASAEAQLVLPVGAAPLLDEERPAALRRDRGSRRPRSQASAELKAEHVDKSALTIPEPPRYRDKEHLRFVAQQACLVFGRKPSDPRHLRFMQRGRSAEK